MKIEPCIILIMQEPKFEPIDFVDDLCVCNEKGEVMVFPEKEAAVFYRDKHSIDGKVVTLPIY